MEIFARGRFGFRYGEVFLLITLPGLLYLLAALLRRRATSVTTA